MRALALDLGTVSGWATCVNGRVSSGTQSFAFNPRYEGGGMRYLKFQRWIDEMHTTVMFDQVVFEEVMQRAASIAAGHVYGGFLAHLTAWCEDRKVPYEGIPVGTIKKHATGKGNAGKDMMIAAAEKLGYAPKDDNEADALCLMHWLMETRPDKVKHETPGTSDIGHTPDSSTRRRVPVGAVPVARRRIKT